MTFAVDRYHNEPIIIVTLQNPIAAHDPIELTRHILRQTKDVTETLYRITDLRQVRLTQHDIEARILPDINFTSWRVRSVVVGVGEMIDYLVAYTNRHFYTQYKLIAFPCVESALAHLRWEIRSAAIL